MCQATIADRSQKQRSGCPSQKGLMVKIGYPTDEANVSLFFHDGIGLG
jgi:hypothetical protein